jgi:hypothetical protein
VSVYLWLLALQDVGSTGSTDLLKLVARLCLQCLRACLSDLAVSVMTSTYSPCYALLLLTPSV